MLILMAKQDGVMAMVWLVLSDAARWRGALGWAHVWSTPGVESVHCTRCDAWFASTRFDSLCPGKLVLS